jgi:hypothetical protein
MVCDADNALLDVDEVDFQDPVLRATLPDRR